MERGRKDTNGNHRELRQSLYKTPQWKALRKAHLRKEPFCRFCKKEGKTRTATVVDHTIRHKGNPERFYDPANLQSLCYSHHNSTKQRLENRGYSDECDDLGYPTDPKHPANQ